MNKFRTLKNNEIEVRPQSVKNGKATMLLYIDSRCVTNILDETVGCMNWQSEFYEVNGQTMGRLGIWDEIKNMWIWKSDTGSESNIEGEKGLISDCYKRLLSRWGVTELYSAPRITWDDDGYGNTGYKVSEIEYDENRKITHLVIANRFGKEQFRWDKTQKIQMVQQVTNYTQEDLEWKDDEPVKDNKTLLTEFCGQMTNNGYDRHQVGNFFRYYEKKCGTWNGKFDVEKLFSNWMSKAA
jgi:hypothetical protein